MRLFGDNGIIEYVRLEKTDTHIVIPEGYLEIAESAFMCQNQLISVTLPKSLYKIGFMAFHGCKNLREINLNYVKKMENHTFSKSGLQHVSIGSLENVPACAFQWCSELKSVLFSDTVRKIEELAFGGCLSLEEIDLNKVEIVEHQAFDACDNLKNVVARNLKQIVGIRECTFSPGTQLICSKAVY